MDIAIILSVVAIIVSVIGTSASILYSRRSAKTMEQQLSFTKEEAEWKRTFLEASKTIDEAIKKIKRYAATSNGYFHFVPLWFSRDNILSYIHDNKLKELQIKIKPKRFTVRLLDDKKRVVIETEKELKELLYLKQGKVLPESLDFDCKPDILENNDVSFGDESDAIKGLYGVLEKLKTFALPIKAFDSTLLDEIAQTIHGILEAIYSSVMSKHEIHFRSTNSSQYIYRELMNKIVGFESIFKLLVKLSGEICERLSEVQRQLFLKY